jgi:predicted ATPase
MIDYLEIKGYKSIKNLELEMKPINILIGSNGVGKSNFVSFFKLINAIFNLRLQKFVQEEKADNLLYFGRKTTENLFGKLIFNSGNKNNNAYYFNLIQTKEGGLFFDKEGSGYNVSRDNALLNYYVNYNFEESGITRSGSYRNNYLSNHLKNIQVFHFHDTSTTSFLRRECDINDNQYLKQDGRNLPAFLYLLKVNHPKIYIRIEKTIQTVAPYIEKFILEPSRLDENEIALRWVDKGDAESNFSAYQLSDGTLRFIALATLLMQPTPPSVIIIDEPELGLHPFAIGKLAGMIKLASSKSQIIVATQSPGLISKFEPEDVIVMDRSVEENQTVFKRLNSDDLNVWFEKFTLGDLWEQNIINSGQPYIKV